MATPALLFRDIPVAVFEAKAARHTVRRGAPTSEAAKQD
jgi:hypothetical protein